MMPNHIEDETKPPVQVRTSISEYVERGPSYQGKDCTVGDIKKLIEKYNLSDDTPVLVERVTDVHFNGWYRRELIVHKDTESNIIEDASEWVEMEYPGVYVDPKTKEKALLICLH